LFSIVRFCITAGKGITPIYVCMPAHSGTPGLHQDYRSYVVHALCRNQRISREATGILVNGLLQVRLTKTTLTVTSTVASCSLEYAQVLARLAFTMAWEAISRSKPVG